MIVERVLVFRSRDGEKARRLIKKGNKGKGVSVMRSTSVHDSIRNGLIIEDIGVI
jgi:hypothetical protein